MKIVIGSLLVIGAACLFAGIVGFLTGDKELFKVGEIGIACGIVADCLNPTGVIRSFFKK